MFHVKQFALASTILTSNSHPRDAKSRFGEQDKLAKSLSLGLNESIKSKYLIHDATARYQRTAKPPNFDIQQILIICSQLPAFFAVLEFLRLFESFLGRKSAFSWLYLHLQSARVLLEQANTCFFRALGCYLLHAYCTIYTNLHPCISSTFSLLTPEKSAKNECFT